MLVLSFSLNVGDVREYVMDYFWPVKGTLLGLDESASVKM